MELKPIFKDFTEIVKAGDGSLVATVATEDIDRYGEIIKISGMSLDNYKRNPIVLYAHNSAALPIGKAKVRKDGKALKSEIIFAPHDFAQEVKRLYDEGFLNTFSVGFIPLEWDGTICTKSELLEFSAVPVPANPNALAEAYQKGLIGLETKALLEGFTTKRESGEKDQEEITSEKPAEPIPQSEENNLEIPETVLTQFEKEAAKSGEFIKSCEERGIIAFSKELVQDLTQQFCGMKEAFQELNQGVKILLDSHKKEEEQAHEDPDPQPGDQEDEIIKLDEPETNQDEIEIEPETLKAMIKNVVTGELDKAMGKMG